MTSLTGHLLIAMPQMGDPFFDRSIVYLCDHSAEEGAMGLIINKIVASPTLDELYAQLKISPAMQSNQPVHFGGPVAPGQGFVLHSADYREEGTLGIGDEFALTASLDVLRATGRGEGPRQWIVAVGYAGWGPSQLDAEIQANFWQLVEADTSLVFNVEDEKKWEQALAKLGVNPEKLSGESGRA